MKKPRLTERQLEVLELIIHGNTSKKIGVILGLSIRTVHVHRFFLIKRLKARNIVDAVRIAVVEGFPLEFDTTKFNKKEGVRVK